MNYRKLRLGAVAGAVAALAAASAGSAAAQQQGQPEQLTPYAYKQVPFASQGISIKQLTAAAQMTKDETTPSRAFTGPTSMQADPNNPRIVVAATANLRDKQCYLTVSRDGGHTWHFSKNLPTDPAYPYCTNTSASIPMASIAWGRNGTLYYAHQAYGDGEGPREGKSSILLARTTDLGVTWKTTLVDNNRGKTGVVSNDSGVPGLSVDTSGPRDVVSVGFNQSFPDAPADSPLKNPNVSVSTSLDGGVTFGPPVELNTFPRPSIDLAGTSHQMWMTGGFGSPFLYAHDGVLLAVAGPGFAANDTLPPAPPEAGAGITPGTWYARPMPQLIGSVHRPRQDLDHHRSRPAHLRRRRQHDRDGLDAQGRRQGHVRRRLPGHAGDVAQHRLRRHRHAALHRRRRDVEQPARHRRRHPAGPDHQLLPAAGGGPQRAGRRRLAGQP